MGLPLQLFAAAYFKGSGKGLRYAGPMGLFILSMVGLVAADDLLLLFLFWELTSFSSFLLIGIDRERPTSRYGAQMALMVTMGGGLFLLAGILLLQVVTGSFDLTYILDNAASFRDDPRLHIVFLLFLIGAMTKSAQFPFHFWLPNAMAAPSPVSAYLHSATMVKAGVYLMARFFPVFGSLDLWAPLLMATGGISFLWGAWVAFHKADMKVLLANTTISGLGLLFFGLGMGGDKALTATLLFLVAHALYKAPLFLMTGVLEKKLGHRDLRKFSGLGYAMPLIGVTAALSGLGMAGFPPLVGFLAKEEFLAAALTTPSLIAIAVLVLGSAFTGAVALRVCFQPFWTGDRPARLKVPVIYAGVPLSLAVAGLVFGVLPGPLSELLIDPALAAVGATQTASELSLWHGFTPALFVSVGIFALAGLLYWKRELVDSFGTQHFFEGDRAYEVFLRLSVKTGALLAGITQSGYLPRYVLFTLAALVLLVATSMKEIPNLTGPLGEWSLPHLLVLVLISLAAILAAVARSLVASLLAMGSAGFAVALFFALSGAPDLALTQFSVECLSLLLFVLCLRDLPVLEKFTPPLMRATQIVVSGLAGLILAFGVWVALLEPPDSKLSEFFSQESLATAHGRNVVNVILVDFRGLDTMGEITVLGIAALGVVVLLGGFHELKRKKP